MNGKTHLPKEFVSVINEIESDHVHGSTYLIKKAVNTVIEYTDQYHFLNISQSTTQQDYSVLLKLIIQAQPQMAYMVTFSNQLLTILDKSYTAPKKRILSFCNTFKEYIESENNHIKSLAAEIIKECNVVFTYSSSSSILQSLLYLRENEHEITVYCSESRPRNEGVDLAKTLAKNGIITKLVTDAFLISQVDKADVAIIGCDGISNQGVINKIGSKPLIKQAFEYGIPTYALSSTRKILPYTYTVPDERQKPADEIIELNTSNISVINTYFDFTPISNFSSILTDQGVLSEKQIISRMKHTLLHPVLTKENHDK